MHCLQRIQCETGLSPLVANTPDSVVFSHLERCRIGPLFRLQWSVFSSEPRRGVCVHLPPKRRSLIYLR